MTDFVSYGFGCTPPLRLRAAQFDTAARVVYAPRNGTTELRELHVTGYSDDAQILIANPVYMGWTVVRSTITALAAINLYVAIVLPMLTGQSALAFGEVLANGYETLNARQNRRIKFAPGICVARSGQQLFVVTAQVRTMIGAGVSIDALATIEIAGIESTEKDLPFTLRP